MDTPLLALTRRPGTALHGPSAQSAAAGNMRQLIQLRWIAVAGQSVTILLVHFVLRIPLPVAEMLGIAAALGLANLLATMALPRHRVREGEILIALLIDIAALTLQLYLSGGATNPFISLYLLQVVLGAILLPLGKVALLAAAAAFCHGLLTIRYAPLALPAGYVQAHADRLFAIGRWIGFVMIAGLLVMFITRISRNLRARDRHVADLRQHAAEEDGIVRMGLFASGAAHELGTPLGTLAVILADWRREEAIARNPALMAELAEMQAEVQRCKAIVSGILHSAGQPRGEAMKSAVALPYVQDLIGEWRALHPGVPCDEDYAATDDAVIAVDPTLRQAVWNMLDNAAEASPAGIAARLSVAGDMVVIAVGDHGPGFPPDALADLGTAYRSTKGAGHGLGLFLAMTVARRLGGRLEANNREAGGAEVRLLLPLAIAHKG